jgi:hypothetical protein
MTCLPETGTPAERAAVRMAGRMLSGWLATRTEARFDAGHVGQELPEPERLACAQGTADVAGARRGGAEVGLYHRARSPISSVSSVQGRSSVSPSSPWAAR